MTEGRQKPNEESAGSVFERMRAEHREVLARIDALEADTDRMGRTDGADAPTEQSIRDVLEHLRRQFDTHMRAEDEVIYPTLEEALPTAGRSVAPLRQEHGELRSMLSDLEGTLGRTPGRARNQQIAVQGQDFVDLLRIHIRKEESVVFAVAERMLQPTELARIATWLKRLKGASTDES